MSVWLPATKRTVMLPLDSTDPTYQSWSSTGSVPLAARSGSIGVAFCHPSFASGVAVDERAEVVLVEEGDIRAPVGVAVVASSNVCVPCSTLVALVFAVIFPICWALPTPTNPTVSSTATIQMRHQRNSETAMYSQTIVSSFTIIELCKMSMFAGEPSFVVWNSPH